MIATSSGKDEGKFWFNLFHEIGHLLLHSKKGFHIDLHEEYLIESEIEREANEFAQGLLVPDFKSMMSELYVSVDAERRLIEIAHENGVSPAILAGRITHELKDVNKSIYSMMNRFLSVRISESNV